MSTATLPERWLTRAEAAEMLQLEPQTLARWAMDGRNLPFSRRGRLIRYRLSDVLAYLEGGMIGDPIPAQAQ